VIADRDDPDCGQMADRVAKCRPGDIIRFGLIGQLYRRLCWMTENVEASGARGRSQSLMILV
jgi:hypothetical protein